MSEHLRDTHFLQLSQRVEHYTGIQLPASKRAMLEGRLQRRVRLLGLPDLAAYGDELFERGRLDAEFPFVVDCATTNKTDFFREADHFDFLSREAVPSLLSSASRNPLLKIWSAACATGAEAYTIAMVLAAMRDVRFSILGTDICTTVLAQAREAIFPASMVEAVPPALRSRFIMSPVDPTRDVVRIAPELRARCQFEQLNLMDDRYPFDRDVDLIFLRNVLIYFAKPVQKAVIHRLVSHLRPGGYLVLGHAESFAPDADLAVTQMTPTIYRFREAARKAA